MRSNKGFGLVELMIVVGIIGILAMIVRPTYSAYIIRTELTRVVYETMPVVRSVMNNFQTGGNIAAQDYLFSVFCSGGNAVKKTEGSDSTIYECSSNSNIRTFLYKNGDLSFSIQVNGVAFYTTSIGFHHPYSASSNKSVKFEFAINFPSLGEENAGYASLVNGVRSLYKTMGISDDGRLKMQIVSELNDPPFTDIFYADGSKEGLPIDTFYCRSFIDTDTERLLLPFSMRGRGCQYSPLSSSWYKSDILDDADINRVNR